jgi:hypothetical protein
MVKAGFQITQEIDAAFRQADMEGRNITQEELRAIAVENDELFDDVMSKLQQ